MANKYFLRHSVLFFCLLVFGLLNAVPADVNVYFIPDDTNLFQRELLRSFDTAKEKVIVASYWITSQRIINELIRLKQRNIDVQVIYDIETTKQYDPLDSFMSVGIIPIISHFGGEGKMHNKFIIIDDEDVWTGSANLTASALGDLQRSVNNENMVRIKSKEIAEKYKNNFLRMQEDIFENYIFELADTPKNQLDAWKRNLMPKLYEKSANFKTLLSNMLGGGYRFNATQKANLTAHIPALAPAQQAQPTPVRPISGAQIDILNKRGIRWQGLSYDDAYGLIGDILAEEKAAKKGRYSY
jgi:hypothetical protein